MAAEDRGDEGGKVCLADGVDMTLVGEVEVVRREERSMDGVDFLGVVEERL